MKTILILFAGSLAVAQIKPSFKPACCATRTAIPTCAWPCITGDAEAISCGATDFVCPCDGSSALSPSAQGCLYSVCGPETASDLLSAASGICAACC